jgi:hypothetical protein
MQIHNGEFWVGTDKEVYGAWDIEVSGNLDVTNLGKTKK